MHFLINCSSPFQGLSIFGLKILKCDCIYFRDQLLYAFDVMVQVDVLDSQDSTNLQLLIRPDLGVTFTKLHCWRLTQFTKCVFMDADTLVGLHGQSFI